MNGDGDLGPDPHPPGPDIAPTAPKHTRAQRHELDDPGWARRMGDAQVAPSPLGDRIPPWFLRALVYTALTVASLVLLRATIYLLRDLLLMLMVALFLSFAMEPAVNWLADRGWRRGAATGLVFVVVLLGGAVLTYAIVDLVVSETSRLVEDAPRYVREATDWINGRFNTEITSDDLVSQIETYQGDLSTMATNVGGRVVTLSAAAVGALFRLLTIGLFAFYLTADGPKFRRTICGRLPPDRQRMVLDLWELAIAKTGGYLYSRMVLAALATIFSWLAMEILGVPYSLALALWMGMLSQFVPVIGTYLAGALPILIALLNQPVAALGLLIYFTVYQQLENYLFAPRVTARTMDIHPAVAFGAVIAGASLIGPVGALLALPVAAILQAFLSAFLQRHEVVTSELTAIGVPTSAESDLRGPGGMGDVGEDLWADPDGALQGDTPVGELLSRLLRRGAEGRRRPGQSPPNPDSGEPAG
ncbi:MAG: AI-2E family transporter [Microthrixaceae bacterium]